MEVPPSLRANALRNADVVSLPPGGRAVPGAAAQSRRPCMRTRTAVTGVLFLTAAGAGTGAMAGAIISAVSSGENNPGRGLTYVGASLGLVTSLYLVASTPRCESRS